MLLHIAWLALSLLGLLVLGWAPATVTLVAALRARAGGRAEQDGQHPGAEEEVLPTHPRERMRWLLNTFRAELVPANLAVGPFALIALAAAGNVAGALAGIAPSWFGLGGVVASAVVAVYCSLAAAHAAALRVLRPEAPTPVLWRGAAAGPILLPLASGAWVVTVVALAVIGAIIVPVTLLAGAGLLLLVTQLLLVGVWEARLADVTAKKGSAA